MAVQIAQAVAFLHSSQPPTVHLDIKPANILVSTIIPGHRKITELEVLALMLAYSCVTPIHNTKGYA